MIRNLESLVRFRNAIGVMLAISAIFAVVLSTISTPGDRVFGQMTTDPVEERAKAWFNSLTLDQAINALLGAEEDAVTDDPNDETTTSRQYVDGDDPAIKNLPIEFIKAAWDAKSDTQSFYDGLPASATDDAATTAVDESASGAANQAGVMALVDGDAADPGDIYAVGDHLDGGAKSVQNIRGFQSVELWWDHMDCAEARTAIGEDNDTLDDADEDMAGIQAESSTVCDATLNAAGDDFASISAKPYSDLTGADKALVDKVGMAILGVETLRASSVGHPPTAMMWWDSLDVPEPATDGVSERVAALYGDDAADVDVDADDPDTSAVESMDDRIEQARAKYAMLNDITKKLVNDRWQYIYHMGGMNDMDLAEVIYWWDSLGDTLDRTDRQVAVDSTQRRIAVGFDNEPHPDSLTGVQGVTFAAEYAVDWVWLNNARTSLSASPSPGGTGKAREERVFKVGRAILGLDPLPDVAAWWNTLDNDQRVNVVYGDPPMRAPYDHDADTTNDDVTDVTPADEAVFQKAYDMLTGSIPAAGLQDGVASNTPLRGSDHLPAATVELLVRHDVTADVCSTPNDDNGAPDPTCTKDRISAKAIVDAIAMELFDPPAELPGGMSGDEGTVVDDEDFDWPYNADANSNANPDNKPANVADWWESTDCRVKRLAVGQDNQYLNAAVVGVDNSNPGDGDFTDDGDVAPEDAETSIYCRHFPGAPAAAADGSDVLSAMAQERVVEVGSALLGLSVSENKLHTDRPSFNESATGDPQITGTAQVGATLKVNTDQIDDEDGDPNDEGFMGSFMYQWLRDGDPIPGATSSSYVLTAADAEATISVRVSFIDGERYPEMRTSPSSLATSEIVGAPGEISKIEPSIRGVTVKAGGEVVLSVKAYGLQGAQDQKLSAGMGLEWKEDDRSFDDDDKKTPWEVTYTAPSSPSTYTITASFANDGDCRPLDKDGGEEMRDKLCTATFQVRVQRPSVPQPEEEAPVNPPGVIPELLADSDGNQYEVFTPVEGGTFDAGEGYSITVPSGAVPNGEYIGIRMSDDGPASNVGMTHQRYTLGGNMYGVHAVDGSGAAISSYVLDDPATVCIPLPASLRSNISHLSLAAINSDGSLTILAAQVRLNTDGDTMVCGNLSNLPSSVAVGSQGAPDAIPTATPMPEPELPVTGGSAPASSTRVLWSLLLGIAVLTLSSVLVIGRRRRENVRSK